MIALITHTVWAGVFAVNSAFYSNFGGWNIGFNPNPYVAAQPYLAVEATSSNIALFRFAIILTIACSPIAALKLHQYLLARFGNANRKKGEHWLDYLIRITRPQNCYLTCYVCTTHQVDGFLLGYQGTLERIIVGDQYSVQEVVIDECVPFLVNNAGEKLPVISEDADNLEAYSVEPMRFMSFAQEEISWIAFDVFPVGLLPRNQITSEATSIGTTAPNDGAD